MYESLLSMKGKVALVTGASSGLGAHFAKVLAQAQAQVVVTARRTTKLSQLVADIESHGGKAIAVAMDVTDQASVVSAFDQAEAAFGTVDVLINNAGVADSKGFLKIDEESWDFLMDTNLKGAWRVAREAAQRLVNKGQPGSIVNISSILGLRVGVGHSTYCISKAGVIQMTKAMALELIRKGIRVNAICPGYFETEMNGDYFQTEAGQAYIAGTPARRLGSLNELDAPLLMLSSDAGSFISGVALPVDGAHLTSAL